MILASAEGFLAAAEALRARPRAADVLTGFAAGEAAEALIPIDMQRSPKAERQSQVGRPVTWFYSHLVRLLHAEAAGMRPSHKARPRRHVDRYRRSHETTGSGGGYIVPAGPVAKRGRLLHAEVERHDDGRLAWHDPLFWRKGHAELPIHSLAPPAPCVARAMKAPGLFSTHGRATIAAVWGAEPLTDDLTVHESADLTERMLATPVETAGLPAGANDPDVSSLYNDWPMPMWDSDLSLLDNSLEDQEAERERTLRTGSGYGVTAPAPSGSRGRWSIGSRPWGSSARRRASGWSS